VIAANYVGEPRRRNLNESASAGRDIDRNYAKSGTTTSPSAGLLAVSECSPIDTPDTAPGSTKGKGFVRSIARRGDS